MGLLRLGRRRFGRQGGDRLCSLLAEQLVQRGQGVPGHFGDGRGLRRGSGLVLRAEELLQRGQGPGDDRDLGGEVHADGGLAVLRFRLRLGFRLRLARRLRGPDASGFGFRFRFRFGFRLGFRLIGDELRLQGPVLHRRLARREGVVRQQIVDRGKKGLVRPKRTVRRLRLRLLRGKLLRVHAERRHVDRLRLVGSGRGGIGALPFPVCAFGGLAARAKRPAAQRDLLRPGALAALLRFLFGLRLRFRLRLRCGAGLRVLRALLRGGGSRFLGLRLRRSGGGDALDLVECKQEFLLGRVALRGRKRLLRQRERLRRGGRGRLRIGMAQQLRQIQAEGLGLRRVLRFDCGDHDLGQLRSVRRLRLLCRCGVRLRAKLAAKQRRKLAGEVVVRAACRRSGLRRGRRLLVLFSVLFHVVNALQTICVFPSSSAAAPRTA